MEQNLERQHQCLGPRDQPRAVWGLSSLWALKSGPSVGLRFLEKQVLRFRKLAGQGRAVVWKTPGPEGSCHCRCRSHLPPRVPREQEALGPAKTPAELLPLNSLQLLTSPDQHPRRETCPGQGVGFSFHQQVSRRGHLIFSSSETTGPSGLALLPSCNAKFNATAGSEHEWPSWEIRAGRTSSSRLLTAGLSVIAS